MVTGRNAHDHVARVAAGPGGGIVNLDGAPGDMEGFEIGLHFFGHFLFMP